jgi:hypothetical protein
MSKRLFVQWKLGLPTHRQSIVLDCDRAATTFDHGLKGARFRHAMNFIGKLTLATVESGDRRSEAGGWLLRASVSHDVNGAFRGNEMKYSEKM